jgi:hypothetical protein
MESYDTGISVFGEALNKTPGHVLSVKMLERGVIVLHWFEIAHCRPMRPYRNSTVHPYRSQYPAVV